MDSDAPTQVRTIESPQTATIDLPARPPEIAFRSAKRSERIVSWLMVFGVALYTGGAIIVAPVAVLLARKFCALFPLLGKVDVLLAICLVFGAIMCIALTIFACGFVVAVLLGIFPAYARLTIDARQIIYHRRRGPWQRTRRIGVDSIRRLLVALPLTTSTRKLRLPLHEQSARLVLETGKLSKVCIGGVVAYPIASELSKQLRQQLSRLRPGLDEIAAFDLVDVDALNRDAVTPTADSPYHVELLSDGVHIGMVRARLTLKTALLDAHFRASLWVLLLPLLFYLAIPWLPPELAPLNHGLGVVLLGYSAFGALMLGALLYVRLSSRSYCATSEYLDMTHDRILFRTRKRYLRGEIAAIHVAHRVGDKGRSRSVLELRQSGGRSVVLASGGAIALSELGALLRHELGLSNKADDPVLLDPSNPKWHLMDDPCPPVGCSIAVEVSPEGQRIYSPAKGFGKMTRVGLAIFGLLLMAAVIGPLVAWSHVINSEDRNIMVLLAFLFGGISLLGLLAIIAEAREEFEFFLGPESLHLQHRELGGTKIRNWRRDEIAWIGTELRYPDNPQSSARLVIAGRGVAPYKISGKPTFMRHLATLLRHELRVGASAPSEDHEAIGIKTASPV